MRQGEAHLWLIDLSPGGPASGLGACLDEKELHRAGRFRFDDDRRRYVYAHGAVRHLLGAYCRRPPARLDFASRPGGKPYLKQNPGAPNLEFNLSHSGNVALLGISPGRRLGVDVEGLRPVPDLDGLAHLIFAPRELQDFGRLPPDRRRDDFLARWTRKEAYAKLTGDGLAARLDQFEVSIDPGEPARLGRFCGPVGQLGPYSIWSSRVVPDAWATMIVEGQVVIHVNHL